MKRLWLALLLVVCPAGKALPEVAGQTHVFSMNLHCLFDDWEKRLDTVLKTLAGSDVGVYAFQEVCVGKKHNQATWLLDRLRKRPGEPWSHQLVYTHRAWDRYDEYLLIVARGDGLPAYAATLPASPLQRGVVAIRSGGTWFVNTHLESHVTNAAFRREQIEFLVKQFEGRPHVILGDFNSSPDLDEQGPFRERGYRPLFPGPTFPADRPRLSIDGFWLSPELDSRESRGSVRALFGPDFKKGVQSDHLGVMLQLHQ